MIIGTADVFGVVVCIEARLILGGMAGMYGSYMSYEIGVAYEDGYDIRVLTLLGDPSTEAMQKSQVWLWIR